MTYRITNKVGRRIIIPCPDFLTLGKGEQADFSEHQLHEARKFAQFRQWESKGRVTIEGAKGKLPPKTEPDHRPGPELPKGVSADGVQIRHLGGGWYEVFVNGMKVTDEKVRTKARAQEIAAEYA